MNFASLMRVERGAWIYRVDPDAIVIADVFAKTTPQTPARTLADCARRLTLYDQLTRGT